ncbi:ribosomal protein S18-alanine N-acetyltransferase [Alloscardovia criceti]|uniref:ribosomal protein S18-alanine N-acetyltransferase n=1 Tax=Alloscardovia criceti TaxID=356828 RepID=UPI000368D71A|nr:ribosomal protein S18-alanine N-acetyltransferase [Alloscardovia criceti]
MNTRAVETAGNRPHSVVLESLELPAVAESDIQTITQLERELFSAGAWSEDSIRQEFTAPDRTYIVAREESPGTIVGYAGLWFDGVDAQIMTVGVATDYQGQHIATQLVQALKNVAKQLGAERVLLEVATDNAPALHVYEAAGFERMGIRKRYYQPENKDAYTMSCLLDAHQGSERIPAGFALPDNTVHMKKNTDDESSYGENK